MSKIYTYNEVIEELKKDSPAFAHEQSIEIYKNSISPHYDHLDFEKDTIPYVIIKDASKHFMDEDISGYAIVLDNLILNNCEIKKEIHCRHWIFKSIDISGSTFSGKADFSGSGFSGAADFSGSRFSGAANFMGSRFSGAADFSGSRFSGAADFWGSGFSGAASFWASRFSDDASFINSIFSSDVNFRASRFSGNANFESSRFSSDANFKSNRFFGDANFEGSTFSGDANFSESTFSRYAYFTDTTFLIANFNNITLEKQIIFNTYKFSDNSSKNHHINFSNNQFAGKIKLVNCDASHCSFLYSDISCFDFINIHWGEGTELISIYDEHAIKKAIDDGKKDEAEKLSIEVERLYRQLKSTFLDLKDYTIADIFFRNELELRRKRQKGIITWEGLYKRTSNYGMSVGRPIIIIIGIFIFFSFITFLEYIFNHHSIAILNGFSSTGCDYSDNFLNSLYYNFCDAFFINQSFVKSTGFFTITLSKLKTALIAALLVLSGFAVRRKFRH